MIESCVCVRFSIAFFSSKYPSKAGDGSIEKIPQDQKVREETNLQSIMWRCATAHTSTGNYKFNSHARSVTVTCISLGNARAWACLVRGGTHASRRTCAAAGSARHGIFACPRCDVMCRARAVAEVVVRRLPPRAPLAGWRAAV